MNKLKHSITLFSQVILFSYTINYSSGVSKARQRLDLVEFLSEFIMN